jgi:hypothetical protein
LSPPEPSSQVAPKADVTVSRRHCGILSAGAGNLFISLAAQCIPRRYAAVEVRRLRLRGLRFRSGAALI